MYLSMNFKQAGFNLMGLVILGGLLAGLYFLLKYCKAKKRERKSKREERIKAILDTLAKGGDNAEQTIVELSKQIRRLGNIEAALDRSFHVLGRNGLTDDDRSQ